ncbi:MAG: M56 family metallopeptidase, partial [Verrucomicrobiota bacterium]
MNSLIDFEFLAHELVLHWLKAGLLLGGACVIIAVTLKRSSASYRHVAWFVALATATILPVVGIIAPPILVRPAAADLPAATPLALELNSEHQAPASSSLVSNETPDEIAMSASVLPSWQAVLGSIWFAGFALLLARLPLAWLRLFQLSKSGNRMKTILTRIPVSCANDVKVPLVWGWKNPEILLPPEAQNWSEDRLRSVLAHEEAHVRRRDPVLQVLAEISRAALWMQPLAWVALRQIRKEREAACDDAALASGVDPKQYANDLLEVVASRMSSFQTGALALAMAQHSGLGGRIRGVLDEQRSRRPPDANAVHRAPRESD